MTKADIVNEISKETGIDKLDVLKTVEAFMESVKNAMANNENVYLRGFGSFVVKKRAQKTARNITEKVTIIVPEHHIPTFKPAKTFTADVVAGVPEAIKRAEEVAAAQAAAAQAAAEAALAAQGGNF